MSDIFKFFKTSLGLPARSTGPAHILGGGRSPVAEPSPLSGRGDERSIEVAFRGDNLGITVSPRQEDGVPEVVSVASGSEAHTAGVRPLDVVTHVSSCPVSNYDGFSLAISQAKEMQQLQQRSPILLRFSRPPPGRKTSDGSRGSAASERARAAEQREAAWSRRVAAASVASARKNKTNDILAREEESQDPKRLTVDAERCINEVKRAEAVTIETLGYNPYRPLVSGSSASRSMQQQQQQRGGAGLGLGSSPLAEPYHSSSSSSEARSLSSGSLHHLHPPTAASADPPSSSPQTSSQGDRFEEAIENLEKVKQLIPAYIYQEWSLQVDECFGILASSGTESHSTFSSHSSVSACLDTIARVLSNLLAHPANDKYSKIRLSNPNFNKKVVSVRGGVEVLIAAGFQLREEAEAECADKEDGAQVLGTETRARPEVLGTETRAGPEVLGTETRAGPEVLGTETRNIYRHDTGKPMQLYFESPAESMSQHRLRYVLCRISILRLEMELLE